MNRHHPYGGYESHHRGGGPSGPGPDRPHRGGRGRGFGRGRGGGGGSSSSFGSGGHGAGGAGSASYDMSYGSAYDQGPSDDMAYSNYEPAQQNSYYQNYGGGGPQPQQGGYNQGGFNRYEDPSGFEEDSFGRTRRSGRKERDDKVHDSIIEERIQRERPCRTLFIRNIKYETSSADVRRRFEEHGDIKTFFDLISTRGMVFVTYYDLRAAERARERLQGSEISGRPIDVHYSLPRDDKGSDDKNYQLQGCLQVTLKNSSQPIDDNEVRRKFQQFGDVKSVQPVGDRIDSRYIEFYDTRACDDAFDRLRHQGLQDGVMDISFAWDVNEGGAQGSHRGRDFEDGGRRGRGGRGRGRGRGRGGGYDHDDDRRDHGRDRDRGGRGRYDDDYDGGRRGGGPNGFNDRYDSGPRGGYPPSGPPSYSQPPPAAPSNVGAPDDRLEQARKVQQLLAALKQPQAGATTPTVPPAAPAPAMTGMPPSMPPPGGQPYYPPAAAPYPPPPNPYGAPMPPPQSSAPAGQQGAPPASALNGLPPNILALLQSAQQQQQPAGTPPGMPSYGVPPPPPMMTTPPPGAAGAAPPAPNYQQLMSFLQSAKRA
ncbi:hypothetical protein VKT23_005250 [Stygiomarasmius scandens]|uniref:RRM domain-containing protein n=1 Tax=Marasmiellus scandens TaxID=2682957 RepID=A0ABR1JSX2_9AGAR